MTLAQVPLRSEAPPLTRFNAPFAARPLPRIDSPFARDVLAGLSQARKAIPGACLFDRRGCELFEDITRRDAHATARTEFVILERCAAQIAAAVGPGATLVGLGSGPSRQTPLLLAALDAPSAYVPVDISAEVLTDSILALKAAFPKLPMHPIVGDIGDVRTLSPLRRTAGALSRAARSSRPWGRRLGFLPGSTMARFAPDAAVALLERAGQALGDDAVLVVGVDATLQRTPPTPESDDREGVAAAFNRNLLTRINRELEGDFDPMAFRHEVRFNAAQQRAEMHLVSKTWDTFEVLGRRFGFAAGESIHTWNAHKYSFTRFQSLARRARWQPLQFWTDADSRFGLHVLQRSGAC
jgi:L-histidine Nalpha-methyltransferase